MNQLKVMTWNIPISWEIQYLWSEKHRLNKLTHCHPVNLDIVVLLYEVLNLIEAFCLNWLSLAPLWQRKVRALALLPSGGGGSLGPSPSLCWHLRQNWDFSTSGWGCEFQLPTGCPLSPLWRWPYYHRMTWKSRFSSVLLLTPLQWGGGGSGITARCGWKSSLLTWPLLVWVWMGHSFFCLFCFLMWHLPRVEQLPSKIFYLTS